MQVAIVEDIDTCERLLPAWRGLDAGGASSIFTSPWWALSSWRHFPDLGHPQLLLASEPDGSVTSILPLTAGPEKITWAGSPLGDEHDVQVRNAARPAAAEALMDSARKLVDPGQTLTLCDVRPDGVLARLGIARQGCPAPTLPLAEADTEFGDLACIPGWSRTRRRGLRSRRAMLHGTGRVTVERFSDPVGLSDMLPRFVEARLAAWAERGRLDELPVMDRHPGFPLFIAESAAGLAMAGKCYLGWLCFNDQPIAQALYFRTRHSDLLYMSTFDERFAKYSPSHLLLAAMADLAWREGRRVIELGRGDEPYKFDHGAVARFLQDVDI